MPSPIFANVDRLERGENSQLGGEVQPVPRASALMRLPRCRVMETSGGASCCSITKRSAYDVRECAQEIEHDLPPCPCLPVMYLRPYMHIYTP